MDEEVLKIANAAREHAMQAKELAHDASMRQAAHEDLCAERYKQILKGAADNAAKLDALFSRLWAVAGAMVLVLLSALGATLWLILQRIN